MGKPFNRKSPTNACENCDPHSHNPEDNKDLNDNCCDDLLKLP